LATILVTGGFGFIGSHTCVKLLENNHNLIVIDSFINSSYQIVGHVNEIIRKYSLFNNLSIFKGDIRDAISLEKIFQKAKENYTPIDVVIHFAGYKSVSNSFVKPLDYWSNNLGGTINLLYIMEKFSCKNLIFSGSASIYGNTSRNPIREDCEINPTSPYAETKAAIEKLLKDTQKSGKEWKIITLRYFNPVGAHPSGLIGENPIGIPNNIFPFLTEVAFGIRSHLKIFGNDWPTIDGTGVRDYIHVMDIADGHVAAMEYIFNADPNLYIFNLGTGIGTSVFELVEIFQKTNNIKIPYEICDRRIGDVGELIADNSLAKSELNWKPKRSLKEMCEDGWSWQSKKLKIGRS
tara:strand:+ start:690 stop:1739 length:1050 start_codon:yes stop_codon:yes gene_type:complete